MKQFLHQIMEELNTYHILNLLFAFTHFWLFTYFIKLHEMLKLFNLIVPLNLKILPFKNIRFYICLAQIKCF